MGRTQKIKKIPSKKSKTSSKKNKTVKIKNIQSKNEKSPSKSKKNTTSVSKSSPSKLKIRKSKTIAAKTKITKSTPKKPSKSSASVSNKNKPTSVSKKACSVPTPSSSHRKSVIVNQRMRNNSSPGKFSAVQKKQIELLLPEGFEEVLGEIHDTILHEDIGNDSKSLAIWLKDFFVRKNGGIRHVKSKEFSGKIQESRSTVSDLTLEKMLEKQSPVFIAHFNSKLEDLQAEYEHKLNQEIESMAKGNEKALQRVNTTFAL